MSKGEVTKDEREMNIIIIFLALLLAAIKGMTIYFKFRTKAVYEVIEEIDKSIERMRGK